MQAFANDVNDDDDDVDVDHAYDAVNQAVNADDFEIIIDADNDHVHDADDHVDQDAADDDDDADDDADDEDDDADDEDDDADDDHVDHADDDHVDHDDEDADDEDADDEDADDDEHRYDYRQLSTGNAACMVRGKVLQVRHVITEHLGRLREAGADEAEAEVDRAAASAWWRTQAALKYLDGDRGDLAAFAADPGNAAHFLKSVWAVKREDLDDDRDLGDQDHPNWEDPMDLLDTCSPLGLALLCVDVNACRSILQTCRSAPQLQAPERWSGLLEVVVDEVSTFVIPLLALGNNATLALLQYLFRELHAPFHWVVSHVVRSVCRKQDAHRLSVNCAAHQHLVAAFPDLVAAWAPKGMHHAFSITMPCVRLVYEEYPHLYAAHVSQTTINNASLNVGTVFADDFRALRYMAAHHNLRYPSKWREEDRADDPDDPDADDADDAASDDSDADESVKAAFADRAARLARFFAEADDTVAHNFQAWMNTPVNKPAPQAWGVIRQ